MELQPWSKKTLQKLDYSLKWIELQNLGHVIGKDQNISIVVFWAQREMENLTNLWIWGVCHLLNIDERCVLESALVFLTNPSNMTFIFLTSGIFFIGVTFSWISVMSFNVMELHVMFCLQILYSSFVFYQMPETFSALLFC